jgi:hypothetical protein
MTLTAVAASRRPGVKFPMKKRALFLFLTLVAAAGLAGCHRSSSAPPVATARLTLNHAKVPLGSPVELTYEFRVAPGVKIGQDYRVFVHFKDADDELMWTDDHFPPTPTSQWKAGETVKYTRLLFVPVYPYVGEASVEIGLYNGKDSKRLPLQGSDKGGNAYRVATLQVAPQTENIYLTFKDGWHLAEVAADNATNEWHWTKKDATISFKNPKRNAVFYLDLDGTSKLLAEPQTVSVRVGGQVLEAFPLGPRAEVHRIPISAAQLGGDDKVELKISVDKTFVPAVVTAGAQPDARELGVRVFHAFVEAQ